MDGRGGRHTHGVYTMKPTSCVPLLNCCEARPAARAFACSKYCAFVRPDRSQSLKKMDGKNPDVQPPLFEVAQPNAPGALPFVG
jgi:hypothetical protein